MDDGDDLKSVRDSDDEIQQPPPKRRKTKYEDLKVVELKRLCKERVYVVLGSKRYW